MLTLAAGVLNPVQSGLTASLDKTLGRPFLVAVASLVLSLLCAVAGALVTGQLGLTLGDMQAFEDTLAGLVTATQA